MNPVGKYILYKSANILEDFQQFHNNGHVNIILKVL